MQQVFMSWDGEFVASLIRDGVIPVIGGGVMLAAMFWIVGYLVNKLFRLMR